MKDEFLCEFRERLGQESLAPNTRRQYYKFAKMVLLNAQWDTPADIKSYAVILGLARMKDASSVSAARNGIRLFCKYFPECQLKLPTAGSLDKHHSPALVVSKRELKVLLECAFFYGCGWGYGVRHTEDVHAQELQGFDEFYGTLDEKYRRQK